MPVKFVTEVVKGLFGISDTTEEPDEETSVTVEREAETAVDGAVTEADDDTEAGTERPGADAPVAEIRGIGPTYSERLTEVGIETVADLAAADTEAVAAAAQVSESRASDWQTQATEW